MKLKFLLKRNEDVESLKYLIFRKLLLICPQKFIFHSISMPRLIKKGICI